MKILNALRLITILAITICIFLLIKNNSSNKKKKFSLGNIDKKFKDNTYYERIDRYLNQVGLKNMFKITITPTIYILIKILLSLLGFLITINEGLLISIILSILGYFLLDILSNISNSSDNEDMLEDIKNIYDTLRVQIKANVYLTTSLTECYLVVKTSRLKKALLELNGTILIKNDVNKAISDFSNKFKNTYIDDFVMVINQYIESGQAVDILNDLSVQIKDIEEAMNIKRKERLKFKIGLLEMLIFIGVTSIIAFNMLQELNGMINAF